MQPDGAAECLALGADTSFSVARVARELTMLIRTLGKPHTVANDNCTELAPPAVLRWEKGRRLEWRYIAPGKPVQDGFVESFARSLMDECLN